MKVHDVIAEDTAVNTVHQNAEVFDRKTEVAFKYLQVWGQGCLARAGGGEGWGQPADG